MSDVIRLAVRNDAPVKRACGTCRHAPRGLGGGYERCSATNWYVDLERRDPDGACGSEGALWEPKPPRIGLIGWIKRLLVGDQKP